MEAPVLLLTHAGDFYVPDLVAAAVERRGHSCIRVDTDLFPREIALSIGSDGRAWLDTGTHEIDLVRVHAVWCRRLWTARAPVDVDARFQRACAEQAVDALDGALAWLERADGGARIVNRPHLERRAERKVLQLRAAEDAGLSMPRTLVTNDPAAARAFVDAVRGDGRVVAKMLAPLSQTMDASGPFMYTSPVDDGDLVDLEGLRAAPMILQARVDKVAEVRAVVVDTPHAGRVLAAALDADAGALDWRAPSVSSAPARPWRAHTLPGDVERAAIELVRTLGLTMAALDFVVDAAGVHWFLEVNPAGEWGWLERDVALPIADALAAALVGAP